MGDTRPGKQLRGSLSSWGFRGSPSCIGQKVPHGFLALEDSGRSSNISGSEGQGQVAPSGKGILGQFSGPFQGSEHLPQTFIQDWPATWLLVFGFWFYCQPPSRGQSCPVVCPGHSKDRWAAGSSAQSHTRNHSFVSHFRVIIELLVERVF